MINSQSGWLDKEFDIYDKLCSLGPSITLTTEAKCPGFITIVRLAGSTRLIHEHTECLIHLPRGGCEHATPAQTQQKMIDMSVERTGQKADVIAARMAEEKIASPADMVASDFATMILTLVTALATLPIQAASTASSTDETPKWAQNFMSKFSVLLATMGLAVARTAAKPITTQGPMATNPSGAITAFGVESDKGQLTVDTGDREIYQIGNKVPGADSPNDPIADGG
ncbi:hypothetical protein EU556_11520 [Hymenobacter fodinae]|uniref:Uncharacterized protein n=1 Tax=Hymenobacter fodinae TaxID=2510796 RepID=A0A4Z0P8S0_9BACT|nr:hypothetical protein EU556_11520 [Hymenobacter fodinae]